MGPTSKGSWTSARLWGDDLGADEARPVKGKRKPGDGTHYTPANLVHDALRRTLTPDCLATRPTVFDPACGSGIFLVEAFRRIVRYEASNRRHKLSPEELREILQRRIFGVEINAEAARVAAFSLYLALLDQQEPPDIASGGPLPPYAEALTTATLGEIFSPTGIYLAAFVSMMGVGKFAAGLAAGAAASQALVFWTGRPLPVFHK